MLLDDIKQAIRKKVMKLPKEIVFATNNAHKLQEVREIVGSDCRVLSLAEIGCHDDIPETADTIEGNALLKARWVKERYGYDCFADDTGLTELGHLATILAADAHLSLIHI